MHSPGRADLVLRGGFNMYIYIKYNASFYFGGRIDLTVFILITVAASS